MAMAASRHGSLFLNEGHTPKLRFNTKNSGAGTLWLFQDRSHEEVPGVRDVPRQGRGCSGVGGRQVDLPFLVPHPAREVPVRGGHADRRFIHPCIRIARATQTSAAIRTCWCITTSLLEYLGASFAARSWYRKAIYVHPHLLCGRDKECGNFNLLSRG